MTATPNYLADIERLVRLESPSDDRTALDAVLLEANQICKEVLGSAGNISEVNGSPFLWWGVKPADVLLLIHLDTVWPKGSFEPLWQVDGDRITAPGSFDMKAGFIQAVYALREITGSVAMLCTTDEEVGSKASRALIEESSRNAKAVLVLEASINGAVKTGRKGTADFVIEVHGRASHAGLEPEKGINATVELAKLVLQITSLENPTLGTTVVPTVMQAGTTTNTVPAQAKLDIDIRSFTLAELNRVDAAIRSLKSESAKVEVSGGINRPPLETSSTLELYEKLEAVAKSLGMPPIGHASVGGASDGNLAAAAGAKVLDGLGAVGVGAHAPSESLVISSVEPRIKLTTAFIAELLK